MQAIIITIISGFFSLAGIWYQNHLTNKSNQGTKTLPQAGQSESDVSKSKKISVARIFFTVLIALLPWLVWEFILPLVDNYMFNNMHTTVNMIAYFSVWLIIILAAMVSGWKLKTLFEKLVLIASILKILYDMIFIIGIH